MDLLISSDCTGSVASSLAQIRRNIKGLLDNLFDNIPNLRVAIAAHGDYCDAPRDYFCIPFTSDKEALKDFVNRNHRTHGGDWEEAYGKYLNKARELDWQSDTRALVFIADAAPHEKGSWTRHGELGSYRETFDWKQEVKGLSELGVTIYPVHVYGSSSSKSFYTTMARQTNGTYLKLDQFSHVPTYLQAIAFKEQGSEALQFFYESNEQHKTNHSLNSLFGALWEDDMGEFEGIAPRVAKAEIGDGDLSRFQIYDITSEDHRVTTKAYIEAQGQTFKKGRSYYELSKTETIQANKKVLMVDKASGVVLDDTNKCREILGVPYGTKGSLRMTSSHVRQAMRKYKVFIQSNSYNRKLEKGTTYMYEIDKH